MQNLASGMMGSKIQSEPGSEERNNLDELLDDDVGEEELETDVDEIEVDDCVVELLVRGVVDGKDIENGDQF